MNWDEAVAYALRLPGTELGTSYGKTVVKLRANGRAFLHPGHEAATSFCLVLDPREIEERIAADPRTFFRTPHYANSDAVLVRYDARDARVVTRAIAASHAYVATKASVAKGRKRR